MIRRDGNDVDTVFQRRLDVLVVIEHGNGLTEV
jgi:hypothetical protein